MGGPSVYYRGRLSRDIRTAAYVHFSPELNKSFIKTKKKTVSVGILTRRIILEIFIYLLASFDQRLLKFRWVRTRDDIFGLRWKIIAFDVAIASTNEIELFHKTTSSIL